jgi:alanyl-tRNA synthetase
MSFNRTLDQGVKTFKKVVASLEAIGSTVFPGKEAHNLFGSMGFPVDLTQVKHPSLSLK